MSGRASAFVSNPGEAPPILLVGYGQMGMALAEGWREQGFSPLAVDPARAEGEGVLPSLDAVPSGFQPAAVVVAVKPQSAAEVLPACARFALAPSHAVVLSIMAGRTVAALSRGLGGPAAVVRAMPNTPAAIRQGVTVACAGPGVTELQRRLCDRLLRAVGAVAWVEEEALLDPVTAVSGGGPAYVFLLAELLETAAVEQGIPPDLARLLARQTVAGAGALLAARDLDAGHLRRAVTSPGGTTERALSVLLAPDAWPRLVSEAVAAATRRSRDLAG